MPKRRHFVLGVLAASGALAVGWVVLPPRQRLQPATPLPAAAGQAVFGGWLKIGPGERIEVVMPKAEMGQGVHTALAQLLAEELDADWAQVRVTEAPADRIYNNLAAVSASLPFHPADTGLVARSAAWLTDKTMREIGEEMTGGSTSVKDLWGPLRQAGAGARAMLRAAAARAWGVPVAEVATAASRLLHAGSGRSAGYGEFAAAAAALRFVDDAPLKPPAQRRFIGRPLARLDAPAKSDGSAVFGLDVRLPGQLFASVTMCPTLGGGVAGFDASSARAQPGVLQVMAVPAPPGGSAGVAVLAERPWQALRALPLLQVQWQEDGPAASFDSAAALDDWAARLAAGERGTALQRRGDVDAALAAAARQVVAEYRVPFLAHATLEPQNCTVRLAAAGAPADAAAVELWAPTQVPGLARAAAARVLGVPASRVRLHVTLLGGGFGRRLEVDFIHQAVTIARDAAAADPALRGRPIQLFWRREEDTRHDFYRPAAVARMSAGLDAQGRLAAWQHLTVGPVLLPGVLARHYGLPAALIGLAPDKTAIEGAFDQPYAWPAARVAHLAVDGPVPTGFWRAVGHSHQAFFKECFLDEVAAAAGADPLAFRLGLLAGAPRPLAVLKAAAELAGWGRPLPLAEDGAPQALGLALHESFGSVVAQVARVSLAGDGAIRVHHVACAIDCGTPVNPNGIRQQMEGGVQFGLSMALYGGVDIRAGRVQQANFHDQPQLRLAQAPVVETVILPSDAAPEGVGEPVMTCIAPAVANALAALTGRRWRSLPLAVPSGGRAAAA